MLEPPICLDTFCKAGGAGMGYFMAGFRVVGIDIEPQPNYPFPFMEGDAIEFIRRHGAEYDLIHASLPCEIHTQLAQIWKHDHAKKHVDLIPDTRVALLEVGRDYVIENVPGARKHLINPVMICGKTLNLKVYRHRFFECSFPVSEMEHIQHRDKTPRAGGGVSPKGFVTVAGHGGVKYLPLGFEGGFREYAGMAMGIDWIKREELSKAIPPLYTQFIGAEWLKQNGYPYTYPELFAPVQLEMFA